MAPAIKRITATVSALIAIIAVAVAPAQAQARKIAKVEVEGLERLSADEVIAASGLKVGEDFSIAELDAAGQRLVDSGLFAKVGYRTTTKGNLLTVVFQIEESKGRALPLVFDNFVWFTNDELVAAIKRVVPSYNGAVPAAGTMTDRIREALQSLLKEHHIDGTVEYAPSHSGEHLFSVAGVHVPICKLHFPGAQNVPEDKLVHSSRQLTEDDYSLKGAVAFSEFTLLPLYREVGQLRAKFGTPVPKFVDDANCKRGVELSIPVEEGPIYLWEKSEWSGNEVLSPIELDATLGMKNGEVANGAKFEKGLNELAKRYGKTGHLEASFNPTPEFDEPAKRVTYKIVVKEGPQYRMGKLTIKGLTVADSRPFEEKWKLKRGDVFDTSYSARFLKDDVRDELRGVFAAWQAQGKRPPEINVELTPNRETLTADVTVEFKDQR